MINTTLTVLGLNSEDDALKWRLNVTKLRTANNIGDEGAKNISESLMINTTLTQLNLWGDDKIERYSEYVYKKIK